MFENSFPITMQDIVLEVVKNITKRTYNNCPYATDYGITYQLNNSTVFIPYRVYLLEDDNYKLSRMTSIEKLVLHCIYSRSCDGYIREKHIKFLLSTDFPDWVIPYIVKVCDEYIVEILQLVYENLNGRNIDKIKQFCIDNHDVFCKSYNRMISYWNEFYRDKCYHYKDYIGRKLFIECFGAKCTMTCSESP